MGLGGVDRKQALLQNSAKSNAVLEHLTGRSVDGGGLDSKQSLPYDLSLESNC
jgi:hypothetical protein